MDRYKTGKYIDENIEDYVFKKEREGYALRLKLNKYEKIGLVSFVVVIVLTHILMFNTFELADVMDENKEVWGLLIGALIYLLKIIGVPMIVGLLYLFSYIGLVALGQKVFGYSLEGLEKKGYDSISKDYGYKLKMLEEFDTQLYFLVDKGHSSKIMDMDKDRVDSTRNDLDDIFEELIKDLNTEVMLGNGYVTRKYEVITIDKGEIKYSTDFKVLGVEGLASVSKLTEKTALEWYKNLTGLNKLNKRE